MKTAKFAKPSTIYETGVPASDTPTVQIQKLLFKAAKATNVVLPKKLMTELDKEPYLVESFGRL